MPDCACFFGWDVVSGKSRRSDRITGYPEAIPKKCGSVRLGDDMTGIHKIKPSGDGNLD